ncbi:MAG: NAD-dependent succinate-semialdehyde dehydrogenase [Alphaproteobacteria bacterium]|nr:NAD-dependent succinate-semialdehyde dehydrogenase [Alphaproteobacteria bacterium]
MSEQTSINPATGEVIKSYTEHDEKAVLRMIEQAHATYLQWRRVPLTDRAAALVRIADVIMKNKDAYAEIIALEMGKPLKEGLAEVEKCASAARYFAEKGPAFLADQPLATEYKKSYVTFQPIGIILGVMPWNFPFWQVLRYAYPALLAGNVCLLKHASNTPGCALAIESIFREAGLPEFAFQSLLIPGKRVAEVIAHPHVAAVTLTGSTPAGRSVASVSGHHLKKTVLELGGSDPYLILEDADIEHAIKTCAASRLTNCGQSCVSAKRMIVTQKHLLRFGEGIVQILAAQKNGDPLDSATTYGPMSRADLRDELHDQVQRSIAAGAKLLLGGKNPGGKSAFYPFTVLTDVKKGIPAYTEEMFGPVAVIIPARDDAHALEIANDTEFGLGGAVFSTDLERAETIARDHVESGLCFVNMMVRSDPRFPFGGVKTSGYGRELSAFGLHEFVNIKTIIVA